MTDEHDTEDYSTIIDRKTNDLKLVHVLWTIIAAAMLVGVAWGVMQTNIIHQGKAIEKKVDKDVFQMHLEAQKTQTESIVESMDKGFDRIDKRLENIEKKP